MEPFDQESVITDAGEYIIELHQDTDAENPLTDWDNPGFAFYTTGRNLITNDTLDEAGDAGAFLYRLIGEDFDQNQVERRYSKWAAITGSEWMLVTGEDSSSRSDFYTWYVLVNPAVVGFAEPEDVKAKTTHAAGAVMESYRKWAAGEFCGFVVNDPAGNHVDSLWSIDDEAYALEEARDIVAADVKDKLAAANLVGAGFVGIV